MERRLRRTLLRAEPSHASDHQTWRNLATRWCCRRWRRGSAGRWGAGAAAASLCAAACQRQNLQLISNIHQTVSSQAVYSPLQVPAVRQSRGRWSGGCGALCAWGWTLSRRACWRRWRSCACSSCRWRRFSLVSNAFFYQEALLADRNSICCARWRRWRSCTCCWPSSPPSCVRRSNLDLSLCPLHNVARLACNQHNGQTLLSL